MVDWPSLLAGDTNGFTTPVLGVRVGDPVDTIPFDRARDDIETYRPGVARRWTDRGYIELTSDGRKTLVPRETLILELHEHPGRVFVDEICYEVEGGAVRQIRVRGTPLADLPFRAEADIDAALGPPVGVERVVGWAVHHFPALGLSVGWDPRKGRVEFVAFGPIGWAPTTLGPREVLGEWFALGDDARRRFPLEEPKDRGTSAWVRYARLRALLLAFGLGSPTEFGEGEFLQGRAQRDYPRATAEVRWERTDRPEGYVEPERDDDLPFLFSSLLAYRSAAESVLRHNEGLLEANFTGTLAALRVEGRANARITAALTEIDDLLMEMISPTGKRVDLGELVEKWGFPDVDVEELERKERWGTD